MNDLICSQNIGRVFFIRLLQITAAKSCAISVATAEPRLR